MTSLSRSSTAGETKAFRVLDEQVTHSKQYLTVESTQHASRSHGPLNASLTIDRRLRLTLTPLELSCKPPAIPLLYDHMHCCDDSEETEINTCQSLSNQLRFYYY